MASAPSPNPQPLSLKSKLPVKRKIPNPNPNLAPKLDVANSSGTSPFGGGGGCGGGGGGNSMQKNSKFNLVGVEVSFSPTLDINNHTVLNRIGGDDDGNQVIDGGSIFVDNYSDAKLSEVNVVTEQELAMPIGGGGGIGEVVARTVMNVFDQSLEEVRTVLVSDRGSDQPVVDDLEKRWREQRVAELDVLGRRLRLVLEHALQKQ